MVIVKLKGGLGNQMFQYAAGKRLALTHKVPFKVDLNYLLGKGRSQKTVSRDYALDLFDTPIEFASDEEIISLTRGNLRNLFFPLWKNIFSHQPIVVREKYFHFNRTLLQAGSDCYLDGFWQSPKYFDDIFAELSNDFKIKAKLLTQTREIEEQIKKTNSICIHVRRGDLVSKPYQLIEPCNMDYFQKAIAEVAGQVKEPNFFIFSDDIKWCKKNFKIAYPFSIVQVEGSNKLAVDFYLMTLCKHFIISNSTFSWWAVWLNKQKEKLVVAPMKWFLNEKYNTKDLIPKNWIRI